MDRIELLKHIPLFGGNNIAGIGGHGWLDSYWGLIAPNVVNPFGIFLLRQYMTSIPNELTIVLCDTGKPRALTDSAYNERRSQCEQAAKAMGVRALRDATQDMLEQHKNALSEVIYKRAKHVITEDQRCLDFVKALDERRNKEIGELMKASHVSLKDDYEVSSPELDAMAEAAWAAEGCVGARMTGAGFGGACVALVRRESVPDFIADTAMGYKKACNLGGKFLACLAVDGARVL